MSELFTLDERRVLVKPIAAQVCERCGEAAFSNATAEQVRRLVHGEGRPSGSVTRDMFALPEASDQSRAMGRGAASSFCFPYPDERYPTRCPGDPILGCV